MWRFISLFILLYFEYNVRISHGLNKSDFFDRYQSNETSVLQSVARAAFGGSNSWFRDEKLASLDRKSHRSNPSSVTQPGTHRSRGHVSEPPSLNPFTTPCPYYNPATTCCCLESSKSPFARLRISNSRIAATGSQSLPVLLIKTLPIIWQLVVRSCHGKSTARSFQFLAGIGFFSRSFTLQLLDTPRLSFLFLLSLLIGFLSVCTVLLHWQKELV